MRRYIRCSICASLCTTERAPEKSLAKAAKSLAARGGYSFACCGNWHAFIVCSESVPSDMVDRKNNCASRVHLVWRVLFAIETGVGSTGRYVRRRSISFCLYGLGRGKQTRVAGDCLDGK